ncbi:MAG: CPBP family intramembrane glutamic endopeptidase, partial [Kiritimatiellia bacterium]
MPESFRLEWVMGVLLVSGLFFWASLVLSRNSGSLLAGGWRWLEWRPLPHDLPGWMLWAFLAGFLLQQLFGSLVYFLEWGERIPVGVTILISILFFQGLMGLVLFFRIHRAGIDPLEALGMEDPLKLQDGIWGLVTYCMCLPLVGASALVTQWIFHAFSWEFQVQPMIQLFTELQGWMNWVSVFLLVGFIGPLLEEVVFRGFLFTWLHQRVGLFPGLILQALIFAVIHMHAASLLPLFFLSLVLGLTYV